MFAEHHESHAASAFFPSPFDEAAILTLDGVGEWATASFGIGRGNRIELPWFAGKVVELGRKHGIPTPTCNLVYAALKPHVNGKAV